MSYTLRIKTNKRNKQNKLAISANDMKRVSKKALKTKIIEPYLALIRKAAQRGEEEIYLDLEGKSNTVIYNIGEQLEKLGYRIHIERECSTFYGIHVDWS